MDKKNYPMDYPVDGVCDICDYFLGEEKAGEEGGHCGYDKHQKVNGLCGANTERKKLTEQEEK
jgi:hypothetical protein